MEGIYKKQSNQSKFTEQKDDCRVDYVIRVIKTLFSILIHVARNKFDNMLRKS